MSSAVGTAYHVGPYVFTVTDVRRTFLSLGGLWRMHVDGLEPPPRTAVATAVAIAERLAAVADVVANAHEGTADADPEPGALLDAAGHAADRAVTSGRWPREQVEVELDAAWLGFRAVAEALRAAGAYGTTASGTVVQLNTSTGGVPKLPVDAVDISWSGVDGDVQAARVHHGRPWQALCLWSADVIDGFVGAGHPIGYGRAGENVTIRGLDWTRMRPGAHVRLGSASCQVSAYSLPCSKNAQWFIDGDFETMHHVNGPVSRVYATVTEPGRVTTGDQVTLEP
jgi:MOSC domain-containing protein YiiM